MQPAIDPFHPLLRVIHRYRQDVHQLHAPTSPESLVAAAGQLGQPIPPTLGQFLTRWNGAVLFRGALRVRAISELAPAAAHARQVIIFADGPSGSDRWAFAPNPDGGDPLFGRWHSGELTSEGLAVSVPMGGAFEAMHERFDRWLAATVRVLDEHIRDPREQLQARLDADPECGLLLFRWADQVLAEGDPDKALSLLRQATARDPALVVAWERLGDVLLGEDQQAARFAYLKALRAVRLPAAYPSVDVVGASLLRTLSSLFPPGDDGWERELVWLLDRAVQDVHDHRELEFVEAAAVELSRVHLARGERAAARAGLTQFLDRAHGFFCSGPAPRALLELAGIEVDLGHHDDAERHLRALRIMPPPWGGRALLVLGRIAVIRQEPWAEEILHEVLHAPGQNPEGPATLERCEVLLLQGERASLHEDLTRATALFEEAWTGAAQLRSAHLAARAALGLGDLARYREDHPAAEAWYRTARERAGQDPELLNRVLIRRGDLFRQNGQIEQARADYLRAAGAFMALSLPLREGWARLRAARVGAPGQIEPALNLFKAADLAAGVAAADSIAGSPGRSLEWHLERSAVHARDRANAQRARPPLTRSDADRPERRIGAHRAAISACDRRVVANLAACAEQCARALDSATPRLTDPNLTRYVAAVDLLSAHRSFEAAEVLLRQLLAVRPGGLAGRALVGVMARSPNAALVDGLLEALEGGFDPTAMAAAAEVLGWRREGAAVPTLRKLIAVNANPTVRKAAIVAVGRIGDQSVVDSLVELLEVPELAEETSVALLLLGDRRGVDEQAQALAAQRPNLAQSTGEVVGRYGGPSYLLMLYHAMDFEDSAGIGALQGLGYLGDPRAVPRLIDVTGSRDLLRARVASTALEVLTGNREDPDEPLLRNRWTEWWARNQDQFRDGLRYRQGQLMDVGLLVERLAHDDALVRRATYDELVISTGERMPFDAEGPYRVQVAHQAAWRAWWQEHRERLPAGRWLFHGELIG